jgi:hypothetical protein
MLTANMGRLKKEKNGLVTSFSEKKTVEEEVSREKKKKILI